MVNMFMCYLQMDKTNDILTLLLNHPTLMQNLTWKHIASKKRLKLGNMFVYYLQMDKTNAI